MAYILKILFYSIVTVVFVDVTTVDRLRSLCSKEAKKRRLSPELEALFFGQSPAQVLYTLEVSTCLKLQNKKQTMNMF